MTKPLNGCPRSAPLSFAWSWSFAEQASHRWTIEDDTRGQCWRPAVASQLLPCEPAQVATLPISAPTVRVKSFRFTTNDQPSKPEPQTSRKSSSKSSGKRTRIQAPGDVVRMQDRLSYLLQPPLESLLADELVELPFAPFDYQLDGIAFLFPRHHAVLADEMGLGKTMQAVTSIRLLLRCEQARRVLLVCPKPLITNWQREFALWAPEIPVTAITGKTVRREFLWRQQPAVSLVNYETLVRDEQLLTQLGSEFDLVVLDESQRIKNRSGSTNRVVCQLARHRSWALTGTPIENSTDDLVGIFDFVSPGKLRPGMKPREMGRAVNDVVLRRTKDQVMDDLPPKMIRDAEVDLSPEQWEAYSRAENEGVVALGDLGSDITLQHVFQLVLRLKQICNFDPVTGQSAKRDRLIADLEECAASGRKAIVFSQWVDTIEKLADSLDRYSPAQYHGKIPHGRRDGVLDRFKNDPNCHVILMSYGAGSVGLNLQFAGYVFLFDRWWNPAVEDQAINRAHRIGAAGPVTVTRFLATNTIEQRIDQILAEKRELFDKVFSEGRSPKNLGLSREELFSLFDLATPEGRVDQAA